MEYTKKEIIEKMKKSNSWRELQIDIKDVLKVFSCEDDDNNIIQSETDRDILESLTGQVKELQDKNVRLMDTNKQLRAENKALRAGK